MFDDDWKNNRRSRRPRRRRANDEPEEGGWTPSVMREGPAVSAAPAAARPSSEAEALGTVTKFDASRGFGFVAFSDGSSAFLHISVLQRAGMDVPDLGRRLYVRVGVSNKGPQVSEIVAGERDDYAPNLNEPVSGIVKFYNADKGFGFVKLDDGRPDVFLHVTALQRSGVKEIKEQQAVQVIVRQGRKGLEVDRLTMA